MLKNLFKHKFSIQKIILLGLLALTLSACAKKIDPTVIAAREGYYANQVTYSRSAAFSTGLKLITNEDPEVLAARFELQAKARLTPEIKSYMKGTKPANVHVLFNTISFSSAGGRILGSDSGVSTTITIKDAATGNIIAAGNVVGIDASVKSGGSIAGLVIATAINAANASENRRMANLIKALSRSVHAWLGRKQSGSSAKK